MEKYDKYFKRYKKSCDENDSEELHIIQDKIYKKFILDISHNKLSTDEIKLLSLKIEKNIFNGPKMTLWYA